MTTPEPRRFRKLDSGHRVMVVMLHGIEGFVGCWTVSCTGCFEFNEGLGMHRYQYDDKAHCYVGHGCSECGYTGKRRDRCWMPINPSDYNKLENL